MDPWLWLGGSWLCWTCQSQEGTGDSQWGTFPLFHLMFSCFLSACFAEGSLSHLDVMISPAETLQEERQRGFCKFLTDRGPPWACFGKDKCCQPQWCMSFFFNHFKSANNETEYLISVLSPHYSSNTKRLSMQKKVNTLVQMTLHSWLTAERCPRMSAR